MNEYNVDRPKEDRDEAGYSSPGPYQPASPKRDRPSIFWPIVLITAGVLLILANFGMLPEPSWGMIFKLWPVLFIALGIDVLLGGRSTMNTVIATVLIMTLILGVMLLIFFAQSIPGFVNMGETGVQSKTFTYPLTGVEEANITIEWARYAATLEALSDSPNLIEANIDYTGDINFNASKTQSQANITLDIRETGLGFPDLTSQEQHIWDIKLSPNVRLDLDMEAGSGRGTFNLENLTISALKLDMGSAPVELRLPTTSSFTARIEGNTGMLTIIIPENVGAQVDLNSGSGIFQPGSRLRLTQGEQGGDGIWETENYGTADAVIYLDIDQGSGMIAIK